MLTGVLAATALLALTPAVRTEPSTADGTLTDGARFAVWVNGPRYRLFDERTGATRDVPAPAGCTDEQTIVPAPSAIGGDAFAIRCGDRSFHLFDLVTGAWASVPETDTLRALFLSDFVVITGIGRHWLEVSYGYDQEDDHRQWTAWIDRATGAVVLHDPGGPHRYPDLDSPRLWEPLCAPLRRFREPIVRGLVTPPLSGRLALVVRRGALVLQRCGHPRGIVLSRSRNWDDPQIGGGLVTWKVQDGLKAIDGDPGGRGRVVVYRVADGRRAGRPIPGGVNPGAAIVHTSGHVFMDKPGSAPFRVTRYVMALGRAP